MVWRRNSQVERFVPVSGQDLVCHEFLLAKKTQFIVLVRLFLQVSLEEQSSRGGRRKVQVWSWRTWTDPNHFLNTCQGQWEGLKTLTRENSPQPPHAISRIKVTQKFRQRVMRALRGLVLTCTKTIWPQRGKRLCQSVPARTLILTTWI